jgi:NAD(P)-dependent dehydrogenase (short-subunit alcohol dehydrogenase family)
MRAVFYVSFHIIANPNIPLNIRAGSGHNADIIGYRMTKAALKQQTRSLDVDFKNTGVPVATVSFEPGYIATRLTRFKGEVEISEACNGMIDAMES